ncbi:MAG TPA: monofunctional biosynthetic peptidoglycan transglycosylase [Blastocatellia bacterium]|nr:monofunctional biosynthetic peptidoglycan transglycosylase [Blastocatellia bacterium]
MFKRILLVIAGIVALLALYFVATYPNVAWLADHNPESTALIDERADEARSEGLEPKRIQTWVPIDKISPNVMRAVLAGEDTHFFEHDGFDYEAIQKAAEENWEEKKFVRGASTITQQLAKNLYLSESKNPLRKLREALITRSLERNLSKYRILEIYLNVIEWGDGIYGVEAAAQTYFGTSASRLSPSQAAYLAAMIPNPRTVYNPTKNPRNVARRQRVIARYMRGIKLPRRT